MSALILEVHNYVHALDAQFVYNANKGDIYDTKRHIDVHQMVLA